jgi:hypothetical protein
MPVHHVDVDPVGAGRSDGADFVGKPPEIRRKYRWRNANHAALYEATGMAATARVALVRCGSARRNRQDMRARSLRRAVRALHSAG